MDIGQALVTLGIGVVFAVAGAVKGVTGMGLPTVAVSLLGLWMAPLQAAALLVVPSLATNVAQCRGPHWRRLVRTLWPAWAALALVTAWLPDAGPGSVEARRWLGVALLLYGAWGLWRPTLPVLPPHAGMRAALIGGTIGATTGVITATTAVFVLPLVPYLQALRLDKGAMVQALGLSFTVATLALAFRLQAFGGPSLWSSATWLATAAAFAGLWLGSRWRATIGTAAFQRGLFVVFMGLGAANLWRAG